MIPGPAIERPFQSAFVSQSAVLLMVQNTARLTDLTEIRRIKGDSKAWLVNDTNPINRNDMSHLTRLPPAILAVFSMSIAMSAVAD